MLTQRTLHGYKVTVTQLVIEIYSTANGVFRLFATPAFIFLEEHLIEQYLHEHSLILVTQTKVNNWSVCFSIANVYFSVYLFSTDVLKCSKNMCIGYFCTINFFYHTAECIFKLINL